MGPYFLGSSRHRFPPVAHDLRGSLLGREGPEGWLSAPSCTVARPASRRQLGCDGGPASRPRVLSRGLVVKLLPELCARRGRACQPQARVALACAENAGWLPSGFPGHCWGLPSVCGTPPLTWLPAGAHLHVPGRSGCPLGHWESLPSGAGMAGVRVGGASTSHPALVPPPSPVPRPCWKCPVLSSHSGFLRPWSRGSRSPALPGHPGWGSVACPGLPCQVGDVLRDVCVRSALDLDSSQVPGDPLALSHSPGSRPAPPLGMWECGTSLRGWCRS